MTNGEYLRQDDEKLSTFINLVTFYCSSRFVDHKSCSEVYCPLAKEGCASCHPDSIMEWLKKEEMPYVIGVDLSINGELNRHTYPGVADDITEEAYDRRDGKR